MARRLKGGKAEVSDAGSGHSSALRHGAVQLPAIVVDTYNADLRDAEGLDLPRFRGVLSVWELGDLI